MKIFQNSHLAGKLYLLRKLRRSLERVFLADKARTAIKKRADMDPWAVDLVSRPIPFSYLRASSSESYEPSDFYGHASVLKSYAKLANDRSTDTAIEHGVYFGKEGWVLDLKNPEPTILTPSLARKACLEELTGKNVFAVGPYIHYAKPFWSKSELKAHKRKLGKTLLFFPSHSTHFISDNYGRDKIIEKLKEVSAHFDTVVACVYWKDVLRGACRAYQRAGFKCICAGHMFDPFFLSRLKSIISLADLTVSNRVGTILGYCVYMGKPHYFIDPVRAKNKDSSLAEKELYEIESAFCRLSDKISPRQMAIVDKYWGLSQVKSPDELRRILLGEF